MKKRFLSFVMMSTPLWAFDPWLKFKTSRTFFFPRPVYHNLAITQQLWASAIYKQDRKAFDFQAIGMYQHSRHNAAEVGGYFGIDCRNRLSVKGDAVPSRHRDIRAEWLHLPSDFSGELVLLPFNRQAAVYFEANLDMAQITDHAWFSNVWFDISAPVVFVQQSIGLKQFIFEAGTPTDDQPTDIIQAFNQADLKYARISPECKKRTALAELRVNAGTTLLHCDDFQLVTWSSLVFPTAKEEKPVYLFDPFVGINRHLGLGTGVRIELPIQPKCWDFKVITFLHVDAIYFFRHIMCRTLDIRAPSDTGCPCPEAISACTPPYDPRYDKPLPDIIIEEVDVNCQVKQWSRYMQYRMPGEDRTVFGANFLTQHVRVRPYTTVDLNTGFKFKWGIAEAEVGYSVWARNAERLELIRPCCESRVFDFQHFGIAGETLGTSSSMSTIAQQRASDDHFVFLTQKDISLASGSAADISAHRFNFDVGLNYAGDAVDCFAGVGGFYELPNRRNSIFESWGVWGKIGVGF